MKYIFVSLPYCCSLEYEEWEKIDYSCWGHVVRVEFEQMRGILIKRENVKTNEDIKMVLARLLSEVKDPRVQQGLLSITATETTGDLKYCKVYLSVLGLRSEKELLQGLKSASGWLRRELGSRMKLRNVPELIFQLDKSMEHGAHINQILRNLDVPTEEEADEEQ